MSGSRPTTPRATTGGTLASAPRRPVLPTQVLVSPYTPRASKSAPLLTTTTTTTSRRPRTPVPTPSRHPTTTSRLPRTAVPTPSRHPTPTHSPTNHPKPRGHLPTKATTWRVPRTPTPSLSRASTPIHSPINHPKPRGHLPTTATTGRLPATTFPTPSTSTNTSSPSPVNPGPAPSVCVHSDLAYLGGSVNRPIWPGDRYNCFCSPHTLRKRVSQLSFRYNTDGEGGQTTYAEAPARTHWCHCSNGEQHVVSSAVEARERCLEAKREKEREFNRDGDGGGSRNGSGRVERLSEVQREVDAVEWGATEKALKKQRDFVWFREMVGKCKRLPCVLLFKRREGR